MANDLDKKYEDFKKKKQKAVQPPKNKLGLFKKKETPAIDKLSATLDKTRAELLKSEKKSFFRRLFPKPTDKQKLKRKCFWSW